MATRSDASLASILLTSRSEEDDAAPLSAGEYWRLVDRVGDPGSLLGLRATGVRDALGSPASEAERVSRLLDRGTALAFLMESLEQQGMHVLSPFDEAYPKRLRDRLRSSAPPLLYAVGALPILELPALGIVGSRDPAPGAARAAIEAAEAAAAHGRAVVSGGAKGIDQLALAAAFSAGGSAIGVLADSLERRLRDPDTRRAIGDERVCLVTPFKPTAGFSVANAMSRN
jgi:predicted Rossmann fold nucleotide-binding protein DprA/Smf involved in DNA uptake